MTKSSPKIFFVTKLFHRLAPYYTQKIKSKNLLISSLELQTPKKMSTDKLIYIYINLYIYNIYKPIYIYIDSVYNYIDIYIDIDIL